MPLSLISSTRLLVHPACLYRLLNRFFLDSACLAVFVLIVLINPSERKGNYSATLNIMKLVHWALMGALLQPAQSHVKIAAHPSTARQHQSPYCSIMARCSALLMCRLKWLNFCSVTCVVSCVVYSATVKIYCLRIVS